MASAHAAWAEMRLSSRRAASSTLSVAVASASSTSPAMDAVNERLKSCHASPWKLSSMRAASTASSKIPAASATRPCTHSAVPSMGR